MILDITRKIFEICTIVFSIHGFSEFGENLSDALAALDRLYNQFVCISVSKWILSHKRIERSTGRNLAPAEIRNIYVRQTGNGTNFYHCS